MWNICVVVEKNRDGIWFTGFEYVLHVHVSYDLVRLKNDFCALSVNVRKYRSENEIVLRIQFVHLQPGVFVHPRSFVW